jgi:putative integral membrane protein (TIGR02587 family)
MQRPTTISAPRTATQARSRSIAKSFQEYARGVAGGLLFSLPMLYTMEVWWTGFSAHPWRMIVYVFATFGLLLGYNRYAGLRHDASMAEVAIDSVEEMGIGLVVAGVFLWLLGRVTFDMTADEIIGKIVTEAVVVAIGVSIGTAELGAGSAAEQGMADERPPREQPWRALLDQLALASCGAVLVAANVAPTEEILLLASSMGPPLLLAAVGTSLLLAATLLYFSHFTGAARFAEAKGAFAVLHGTAITYASALAASAVILWFFGRFAQHGLFLNLAQCVVLGIAGTLGASAGRLLLR